jgi:hypothetical protein
MGRILKPTLLKFKHEIMAILHLPDRSKEIKAFFKLGANHKKLLRANLLAILVS